MQYNTLISPEPASEPAATFAEMRHEPCSLSPDRARGAWPFESPALCPWSPGEPAAYEMKLLLDEAIAREIEARLRPRLASDPFADRALGHAYRVSTLYCDTAEFAVYHRVGPHRRRRYRLRSYGGEPRVYLERKTRHGERVWKRRSAIDRLLLPMLGQADVPADWPGGWFHEQIHKRSLRPTCCLSYLRTALVGEDENGPMRVTFDREICSVAADSWSYPSIDGAVPALSDGVVCEFKFRGALPGLFKSILFELRLSPSGVSKYRRCLQALKIVADGRLIDA